MDYVVGSVAALISGNVTPNRPKLIRRALTPTKHQQSPNVTPKSEVVDDRSIFLSPTLQKKKAIIKKSPKRIFQNPDLDVTSENENNSSSTSPKAEKVKKHLKDELDADVSANKSLNTTKSPKKHNQSEISTPKKTKNKDSDSPQSANETTPKKQKKNMKIVEKTKVSDENVVLNKPTKKNKKRQSELEDNSHKKESENLNNSKSPSKKKKKLSISHDTEENESNVISSEKEVEYNEANKKPRKKNKKKSKAKKVVTQNENQSEIVETKKSKNKKNKNENFVNPNAVTDKDSDSEHESDDEIVSENEEANKEVLDTGPVEESSDEEETTEPKKPEKKEKSEPRSEDEIKRTLFIGNVLFSKKCKKEIKRIFSKYGDIETVRIRTIPVKDARVTPKLALIKNELHPERTTVNVYVKYKHPSSVEQALVENNTVLNERHLRVSRSECTGAEHDPRCSIFVGNVPFAMEDEALREKFEQCGEIESVRIIRDKKTNAGKGFAYVNFASKDGVELALALSDEDLTIKNRILRVKRCTQLTQKQKNQESRKGNHFQGKNQNFQHKNPNFRPNNQGGRNFQNRNQIGPKGGNFKQRQGQNESVGEGAHRRIMHKRKNQDGSDGPPNKRPNQYNQPQKEKKTRKEFVGMTAEKKKKHTFNKGQKKKKALSEILTKA